MCTSIHRFLTGHIVTGLKTVHSIESSIEAVISEKARYARIFGCQSNGLFS